MYFGNVGDSSSELMDPGVVITSCDLEWLNRATEDARQTTWLAVDCVQLTPKCVFRWQVRVFQCKLVGSATAGIRAPFIGLVADVTTFGRFSPIL